MESVARPVLLTVSFSIEHMIERLDLAASLHRSGARGAIGSVRGL